MRMSCRGVRGLAPRGFRQRLELSFNSGEAREGLEEMERGCHVSALMQGNCWAGLLQFPLGPERYILGLELIAVGAFRLFLSR